MNGIGEAKDELVKWAQGHGATFPIALNKTPTDLVKMFSVRAYPTNVIYDREGKVVYKAEGFDPDGVAKALGEGGIR